MGKISISTASPSGPQTNMRLGPTKRSIVRFLAVWATWLAMSPVAMSCAGQSDDAFRIGVTESLTGPGETYGTLANQSKQMAADEIDPYRH